MKGNNKFMSLSAGLALAIVAITTSVAGADDQFRCCMSGMKSVHGVVLCDGPCCPGYEEKVDQPPLLEPVIYCKKVSYRRPFLLKPTIWKDKNARPVNWYHKRFMQDLFQG